MNRHPLRSRNLAGTFFVACLGLLASGAAEAGPEPVTLPVPAVTLYPGDVISGMHLVDRTFRLDGKVAVESRLALVGKVVRRTLLPGQPIPLNAIDDPKLVRRGVPTQVVFRESDLVITGIVEPMASAAVNETVKARNPDTGLIVVGVVQADGTIRVGSP